MKCEYCKKEMMEADGCVKMPVLKGGKEYDPIKWEGEGRCHDCNVKPGEYHHPGCDAERCPICGGQVISCGCHENVEG